MSTTTTHHDVTYEPAAPGTPSAPDRRQRFLTTLLWAVLVLAMTGIVGAGLVQRFRRTAAAPPDLPTLFESPSFTLTDQASQSFSSDQLRGRPFVATFIFTHCADVCPMMTQKMAKLQKTIPTPDVKLVSFTVDAKRDTPDVLKEYAARFKADATRWHFLTGTQEQMDDVARGMNVGVMKMADGTDQFTHSNKFFLIDGFGHVRGIYGSNDEEELKALATDAAALAEYERHGGGGGGRS